MQEASNSYITGMRKAQDIFKATPSIPSQQNASINDRSKRKRSSSKAEFEEVEKPTRKKRCLEEATEVPA